MKTLFADTGYWIALIDKKDACHTKATRFAQMYKKALIITSDMVLTEVLAYFCNSGQFLRSLVVQFIRKLENNPNIIIIPQSKPLFNAAFELYAQMNDKEWSLTDCASFEIMAKRELTEALAFDKHFEQAGFLALLRQP